MRFFEFGLHWQILNFLIFAFLLWWFLRKPLREFWQQRRMEFEHEFNESRRLYREALDRYEVARKRLANVEEEKSTVIQSIKEEGELEKHRIIERADEFAKRLKEDARRAAEQEIRSTRKVFKKEMVDLSIRVAMEGVKKGIKVSDQKRLVESYLEQIERE